jgi:hypothetical protein
MTRMTVKHPNHPEVDMRFLRLYEDWTDYCELMNSFENFELDPEDYLKEFREYIDEQYEMENGRLVIMGIRFTPSTVMEKLDDTAFTIALNQYAEMRFESDPKSCASYEWAFDDIQTTKESVERQCEFLQDFGYVFDVDFEKLEMTVSFDINYLEKNNVSN